MAPFSFRFRQKRLQAKARRRVRDQRLSDYLTLPGDRALGQDTGAIKKRATLKQSRAKAEAWPAGFRRLLSLPGLTQLAVVMTGLVLVPLMPLSSGLFTPWLFAEQTSHLLLPWHYHATLPWVMVCVLVFPPPVPWVALSLLILVTGLGVPLLGQFSGPGFFTSPVAGYWLGFWLVSLLIPLWMHHQRLSRFWRRGFIGLFAALVLIHSVGSLWLVLQTFSMAIFSKTLWSWASVLWTSWLCGSLWPLPLDLLLSAAVMPLAYGARRIGCWIKGMNPA